MSATTNTVKHTPDAREWLIRKDGYFYRPNCQGYTTSKFEAGRYTREKAEAEASVEPWHMKAVHQDEWPDDAPSITVRELRDALIAADGLLAQLGHSLPQVKAAISTATGSPAPQEKGGK